jgi:hypothetical protein
MEALNNSKIEVMSKDGKETMRYCFMGRKIIGMGTSSG